MPLNTLRAYRVFEVLFTKLTEVSVELTVMTKLHQQKTEWMLEGWLMYSFRAVRNSIPFVGDYFWLHGYHWIA